MECEHSLILVQYSIIVVFAHTFRMGSSWLSFNWTGCCLSCSSFSCCALCLRCCSYGILSSRCTFNLLWNHLHDHVFHFCFILFFSSLAYFTMDNVLVRSCFIFCAGCNRNTSSLFPTLMAVIFKILVIISIQATSFNL